MTAGRGEYDRGGRPQSPRAKQNDLTTRLEHMMQYGVVEEVDHARGRARVRMSQPDGENGRVTNWIPWTNGHADSGSNQSNPLQVGAQVVVAAPSGDQAHGFIIPGIHSDANPPPSSDGNTYSQTFEDGTTITHNKDSSSYELSVPAGGQFVIRVGGTSLTITDGNVVIDNADVHVKGSSLRHNSKEVGDTHGHVSAPGGPPGPPV